MQSKGLVDSEVVIRQIFEPDLQKDVVWQIHATEGIVYDRGLCALD